MKTLYICVGSACHLKGSYTLINSIQDLIETNKLSNEITIKAALCLGNCTKAVSVKIDEGEVFSASVNDAEGLLKKVLGQ